MDDFTALNNLTSECHMESDDIRSRMNSGEIFDVDFESFDMLDEDQQTTRRESPLVIRQRQNADIVQPTGDHDEDDGEEEDEHDMQDEDIEDKAVDPPSGYIRIRPSKFHMIPSTVFVEYPKGLGMMRSDTSELESERDQKLHYRCQWARNCIKNAFTRAGFEESAQNWTVLWAQHQTPYILRGLNCLQKVNHFPGSWALGRKDRLSRTIWAMKRLYPSDFNFHPESFVLPVDKHCLERCAKADVFYNKSVKTSKQKRLWITKPVASSCGKGIKVITAERALVLSKSSDRKMLVQRYLSDPYLINKKKFDMRLYVLVTGVDPLRIYLHEEGLIRMATENFSVKSLKNPFIHLTNYSINKKSKHFCASTKFNFEEGTDTDPSSETSQQGRDGFKWTLKAFKSWLAEKESPARMEQTMTAVSALVVKTMLAAESDLSHSLHATANYRTNCFELFGFDVFLDAHLTPHLIEVNVSPSLAGSSPLDTHIKGVLVADVCHVTGFHAHDETLLEKYHSTHLNISKNNSNTNNNSSINQNSGTCYPSLVHRPSSAGGIGTRANSISGGGSTIGPMKAPCEESDKDKDEVNPFSFASLSKLMAGQAEWRKDMTMRNINLASLGQADAAWYMLLMVEDEFDRAEQSKFQKLHPALESIDRYMPLYKNARFSDQLLGKWLKGGMSEGKGKRLFLPKRFKENMATEQDTAREKEIELEEEMTAVDSSDQAPLQPRGTGVALARARGRLLSVPIPSVHSSAMCWRPVGAGGVGVGGVTETEGRPSSERTRSAEPRRPSTGPPGQVTGELQYNIGKEVTVISKRTKKDSPNTAQYFNLKNNLKQQQSYLYDPVERKKKPVRPVYPSRKLKKREHTTVVFEPSVSGCSGRSRGTSNNANVIGDMYKHLLLRNMRSSSISGSGGNGGGVSKGLAFHRQGSGSRDKSAMEGLGGLGGIAIHATATVRESHRISATLKKKLKSNLRL